MEKSSFKFLNETINTAIPLIMSADDTRAPVRFAVKTPILTKDEA